MLLHFNGILSAFMLFEISGDKDYFKVTGSDNISTVLHIKHTFDHE
jgi:hypothetical protein